MDRLHQNASVYHLKGSRLKWYFWSLKIALQDIYEVNKSRKLCSLFAWCQKYRLKRRREMYCLSTQRSIQGKLLISSDHRLVSSHMTVMFSPSVSGITIYCMFRIIVQHMFNTAKLIRHKQFGSHKSNSKTWKTYPHHIYSGFHKKPIHLL